MSSFYFIGEKDLLTGLHFAGVKGAAARDAESARLEFSKIKENPGLYHILIVTEEVSGWLAGELNEWQLSGRYPLVVEIPGLHGRIPGAKSLVDSIREAIGVHV